MADYSLRGYLERRTTEELDAILAYCLREENYANYEYAICEILEILNKRNEREKDIRDRYPTAEPVL